MLKRITIFTFICLSTHALAGVPHTFTAGTPAKAAEVNDNFTSLYLSTQKAACLSDKSAGDIFGVSNINYISHSSNLGDIILYNGQSFTITKVPFIELGTGDIYEITLPLNDDMGGLSFSPVEKDKICSNTIIDSYATYVQNSFSYSAHLPSNGTVEYSKTAHFNFHIFINETDLHIEVLGATTSIASAARNSENNISNIINLSSESPNMGNVISDFNTFINYISIRKVTP